MVQCNVEFKTHHEASDDERQTTARYELKAVIPEPGHIQDESAGTHQVHGRTEHRGQVTSSILRDGARWVD
jgi:hypothetical protein